MPVWQEDVKVWEVTDKDSGQHIGLWYLDPYARQGKRSGAWANTFRSHTTFDGKETVLATNNSNFVKGARGEPTLISWDDAETYFHEFGHLLGMIHEHQNPSSNPIQWNKQAVVKALSGPPNNWDLATIQHKLQ